MGYINFVKFYSERYREMKSKENNATHVKNIIQTMASMNYFDSNRKNPTNFSKWKSVMKIHVIAKFTLIGKIQLIFLSGSQ
jgi:hypothetical protein